MFTSGDFSKDFLVAGVDAGVAGVAGTFSCWTGLLPVPLGFLAPFLPPFLPFFCFCHAGGFLAFQ
jgi:hypothetical protein